jgi:tetratricopeptide (TPR) repeat protein
MNEFEREHQPKASNTSSSPASRANSAAIDASSLAGPIRPSNQVEQAIREFEQNEGPAQVVPSLEDIVKILMNNAGILIEAGDYRLALNLLRNVLMRVPDHPGALEQMGLCLREEGRFDEALKCFRALVRTERKFLAQCLIAETLYLGERDDMALGAYREVLKTVIEDQSQLFEIYKNIGNIHVRAGDFESAEEFYNKAYTLVPNSDVLMVNYGTLEIQRDSMEEAVLRFRRAVDINPENDKGWVGLALVHRQMGDLELAWANVQRALDINRHNRTAIRLVVDWGIADHREWIAITRLQDYLEAQGEDAEMSFTLAKVFTHVGRLPEARLEMERVLALDPMIEGAERMKKLLDRELSARKSAPLAEKN